LPASGEGVAWEGSGVSVDAARAPAAKQINAAMLSPKCGGLFQVPDAQIAAMQKKQPASQKMIDAMFTAHNLKSCPAK
jgi:hypothetical protein